jgi:hypothetical protein
MFGRDPIIPLDLMVGDSIQEVPPIKLDALSKLRERSNDRTVESTVRRMNLNISKNKGRDKETSEYYDEYLRSSKVLRSLRR